MAVAAVFGRPRQEVLLVRHGESHANAGGWGGGAAAAGPRESVLGGVLRTGFDCGLTARGATQAWEAGVGKVGDFVLRATAATAAAAAAAAKAAHTGVDGGEDGGGGGGARADEDAVRGSEDGVLVVVSPLTRALETAHLVLEGVDAALEGRAGAGARSPVRVAVHPLAAEHLWTAGDVGRPRSELVGEFCGGGGPRAVRVHAALRRALEAEWGAERWWHRPDANDCRRRTVGAREGRKVELGRRCRALLAWVRAQRETRVVLVGHSTWFLAAFPGVTRGNRRMDNGECVRVPLR